MSFGANRRKTLKIIEYIVLFVEAKDKNGDTNLGVGPKLISASSLVQIPVEKFRGDKILAEREARN